MKPKALKMVLRGFRGRCPRCGGGKLFKSWFAIKERCPTCCYRIDREKAGGFWLGGYVMNTAIGESLLALYLFWFALNVIWHPDMAIKNWMYGAVLLGVVPPLLFFPLSRTTWMAVDLLIHPLEPYEVADAELACADRDKAA